MTINAKSNSFCVPSSAENSSPRKVNSSILKSALMSSSNVLTRFVMKNSYATLVRLTFLSVRWLKSNANSARRLISEKTLKSTLINAQMCGLNANFARKSINEEIN